MDAHGPNSEAVPASVDALCAYCGREELTGAEDPEHAVPAAVAGRFTTTAVSVPCNRAAGRDIDQPWLDDPFVLGCRFQHAIPDRRGRIVDTSPFLTGRTEDGRWVTMGRDGVPVLRNTPVTVDEAADTLTISAADKDALAEQIDKQRRKLERAGRSLGAVRAGRFSDQPAIAGGGQTEPGRWHRMGAKVALALLAEQQPAEWRRGDSAQRLRSAMRERPSAQQVRFAPLDAVAAFAPSPTTAVILTHRPNPMVLVSLMGIFGVAFALDDDFDRTDWAWVSDPLDPAGDADGPLAEVIYARYELGGERLSAAVRSGGLIDIGLGGGQLRRARRLGKTKRDGAGPAVRKLTGGTEAVQHVGELQEGQLGAQVLGQRGVGSLGIVERGRVKQVRPDDPVAGAQLDALDIDEEGEHQGEHGDGWARCAGCRHRAAEQRGGHGALGDSGADVDAPLSDA